ncbi:hypothetical protein B0H11DRAFT_1724725, partial [Mycena galericulata]
PKWAVEGLAMLSECTGGDEWDIAVRKWTELERAYGLKSSSTPLPTTGRPGAIGAWIKNGRRLNKIPLINLETHVPGWWEWWGGIAPAWRKKDAAGRPIIGGHGSWGDLVRPGGNGMLTVLLGLAWWYKTEGKTTAEWVAAVKDVAWVLGGLLSEAR